MATLLGTIQHQSSKPTGLIAKSTHQTTLKCVPLKEQYSIFSSKIDKCSSLVQVRKKTHEKLWWLNSYCSGLRNVPNFSKGNNNVITATSVIPFIQVHQQTYFYMKLLKKKLSSIYPCCGPILGGVHTMFLSPHSRSVSSPLSQDPLPGWVELGDMHTMR